jgi:L-iditol 2-dehydrogenase
MKAAIFKELGKSLDIGEVQKPVVEDNEILMKVKAAAICIADIYSIKGERPLELPHVMGHEAAGIVAEVGRAVQKLKPGDRILGNAIVTCGKCYYCQNGLEQVCENHKIIGTDSGTQGAFAEYYKLPAENMYHGYNESSSVSLSRCAGCRYPKWRCCRSIRRRCNRVSRDAGGNDP